MKLETKEVIAWEDSEGNLHKTKDDAEENNEVIQFKEKFKVCREHKAKIAETRKKVLSRNLSEFIVDGTSQV